MARWRLTQPHYLNVKGTEWEYKEIDRGTGKQVRKIFPVPLFLNPEDPADWNEVFRSQSGQVIGGNINVSDGVNADPKDLIFSGPPTPDMEPIDEEAQAISEAASANWQHPIESLPGNYSQSLLTDLQRQVAETMATTQSAGVPAQQFMEMQGQMMELMKQNAAILATLAAKVNGERRA